MMKRRQRAVRSAHEGSGTTGRKPQSRSAASQPLYLPHPAFDRLLAALHELHAERRWLNLDRLSLFRAATPPHDKLPALIDGKGAQVHGSRWCSPDKMRIVHACPSSEQAVQEYYGTSAQAGVIRPPVGRQLRVRELICSSPRTLDLTSDDVQRHLHMTLENLISNWRSDMGAGREALTQAVGRAAWVAGFSGLKVPSAAIQNAFSYAIFVDDPPRSHIAVVDR